MGWSASDAWIETDDLAKSFKVPVREEGLRASARSMFRREHRTVDAVAGVTIRVAPGEIVGFLGPNGAGKTTTLKMLSGLLSPTGGQARVLGYEPFRRDHDFLRRITLVMGNRNQLQWDIPVVDSYELHRSIYRIPRADFVRTRDELVGLLDLGDIVNKPARNLSLGERMKAEIVDSLLHQPQVMFLDEPTLGLDVTMQRRIRQFFADYNARTGASIMLTSHYMADVEALCKRVVVIHHGRVLFDAVGGANRFGTTKTIRVVLDEQTGADADAQADIGPSAIAKALDAARSAGLGVELVDDAVEGSATFRVDKASAPKLAGLLLSRLAVVDVSIEDPAIETVIEQVFAGG